MHTPGWRNWAGTVHASPRRVERPAGVEELAEVISAAARAGDRLKPVGAGHSFTPIAATDGVCIDLDRMRALSAVDTTTGLVTVQAGARLYEVNRMLAGHGLAMSNLGDIDRQTIAGAISTGTHGTGAAFGGLATQVVGLRLVLADGSVVDCSATERADLFAAARIGLGALGVIAAVTLACEPAFLLRAAEGPDRLDRVLADLDGLIGTNEHAEFYWFPHTDRVLLKRNNRVPAVDRGPHPARRIGRWVDDELLGNACFGLINRLTARFGTLTPAANAIAARALTAREYVDTSSRVFCTPRRVVFREMEYALPRAALVPMLRELRRMIERDGFAISFPVEVRFAAADDIWLSTAYGRETAYVAVHQYHQNPYEAYFRAVGRIADSFDGRPHWGKVHWLDAERLADRYPRYDDFRTLRDEVDPDRRFANPYLERVLGA